MKLLQLLTMSSIAVSLNSCAESTNEIESAIENEIVTSAAYFDFNTLLDMPFESGGVYEEMLIVDVLKGGVFSLPSGCTLKIPENAFAHLNDEAVDGEVVLKLKEYKTLGDILMSGIDMRYDSAGMTHDFISGGMFMIEGFQDEVPVKIAKDKSIDVAMTSYVEDTPCFNFYSKNEDDGWDYITTKEAADNPNLKDVPEIIEPEEASPDQLVFDLSFTGVGAKSLEGIESVLWKYNGFREDTLDLSIFTNASIKNTKIENTRENQLSYVMKSEINGVLFTMPITPALTGANFDKAMANFNKQMEKVKNNQEALDAISQGKYVRSISIPSFGIFNWDVIHKSDREPLMASFDFGLDISEEFCSVFLISQSDNSIVNYSTDNFSKFSYNPKVDNKIIATLPDNKVAVLSGSDFIKQVDQKKNGQVHFKLDLLTTKVYNSTDIDEIIQVL